MQRIMKALPFYFLAFFLPLTTFAVMKGEVTYFTSPNGRSEQCIRLNKMPGGVFSEKDNSTEAKLCGLDIYQETVAVCPKIWSTSPGTMLYNNSASGLTQAQYESQKCGSKTGHETLSKFKNTMNTEKSSATFAQSSLLYYHFSRYLQTIVKVPVAVYRSFDKDSHYDRVSSKAKGMGAMNQAGWDALKAAEQNPSSYTPTRELFTPDNEQIYGVLLGDASGERYGAELNGVRSSWTTQSEDFQKTPAFTALRSEQPFAEAVKEGITSASKSKKISTDVGTALPLNQIQMGLWMRELIEITLMDFIFSQQDRVGNIDYEWYWVYVEGGQVKAQKEKRTNFKNLPRNKMKASVPEELAALNPTLVQKSVLGDNDAGGRVPYANFTKRTKMLDNTRHYDAVLYKRLMHMNKDFQANGPILQHIRETFYLSEKQVNQIVANTNAAATILQQTCSAGKLRFDLNFDAIVLGQAQEVHIDCVNP